MGRLFQDVFFCKFSVPSKSFFSTCVRVYFNYSKHGPLGTCGLSCLTHIGRSTNGQALKQQQSTSNLGQSTPMHSSICRVFCCVCGCVCRVCMREYACVRRRPDMCFLDRMQNIGIFCIDRRSNQAVLNKARTSSRFPILKYTRKRQATFIEHGMTKTWLEHNYDADRVV